MKYHRGGDNTRSVAVGVHRVIWQYGAHGKTTAYKIMRRGDYFGDIIVDESIILK
jgi:hypothetical protein